MDIGNLAQWAGAALSVIALSFSIIASRSNVQNEMHGAHKERLDRHDMRLTAMEADFRHVPTTEALHNIGLSMAQLEGKMGALAERLSTVKTALDRVQEAMLEK